MAISWEIPQPSVIEINLKITNLGFNSNLTVDNELKSDANLVSIFKESPLPVTCIINLSHLSLTPVLSCYGAMQQVLVNTLRQRQDGCHFPDDIFRCILLNENIWITINISLSFVPKGPIDNIPALVQIMAWRRSGDKPLSEPMMVCLLTHICVTWPQWVNSLLTVNVMEN